jgi:thymidylate synthase
MNQLDSFENKRYMELPLWLEKSRSNWSLIDRYSAEITRFKDLEEYKGDVAVKGELTRLWDMMDEEKVKRNDDTKIDQIKKVLEKKFKESGEEAAKTTLNDYINENKTIKENLFDLEINQRFE